MEGGSTFVDMPYTPCQYVQRSSRRTHGTALAIADNQCSTSSEGTSSLAIRMVSKKITVVAGEWMRELTHSLRNHVHASPKIDKAMTRTPYLVYSPGASKEDINISIDIDQGQRLA